MAEDAANAESLAPVVLEAASRRWTFRLFPRLLDVLEEWVREDPDRLPTVLDAFGRATGGLRRDAAAVALVDAAAELRRRLAGPPEPKPVRSGWVRPRPGGPLPLPRIGERLDAGELRARRLAFVDARLPGTDRTAYVTAAFEAFLAASCDRFLGGEVADECEEAGLRTFRRTALDAGLAGLSGDGTEPGLVEAYLGVDPSLTTRVLDEVSFRFPSERCEECVLLRAWLRRPPTRWKLRAALEPPLLP